MSQPRTASFVLLPVPPPPPPPKAPKVVAAAPEKLPTSPAKKPSGSVFSKVMTSFSGPNDGFDKCPVCAKTVPKGKRVVCAGAPWHIACFVCGGPEKTGCKAVLKFGDYKVHSANPYCLNCYEVVSIIPIPEPNPLGDATAFLSTAPKSIAFSDPVCPPPAVLPTPCTFTTMTAAPPPVSASTATLWPIQRQKSSNKNDFQVVVFPDDVNADPMMRSETAI